MLITRLSCQVTREARDNPVRIEEHHSAHVPSHYVKSGQTTSSHHAGFIFKNHTKKHTLMHTHAGTSP